ncbi:MAG: hypothetical protein C4523_13075 [Myxococcales bacterium]|nr:MAG: hypothetical protein C4523_13075 [Myxococcales bacterium]
MLQYDLTQTALFESASREELPTEAEMFILTVSLLLVRDAAYSDLEEREMGVADEDVAALAECIEYRLSTLACDFGDPDRLRDRLRRFVGLRIGQNSPDAQTRCAKPT